MLTFFFEKYDDYTRLFSSKCTESHIYVIPAKSLSAPLLTR